MDIRVEHHPKKIEYDKFCDFNDLCFPHEPVSEYEFQAFMAAEFWGSQRRS